MALVGQQTQGSRDLGPDVGYNPVEIPKRFTNAQLDIGGVQSVENQRMAIHMGTEFLYYDPEGSDAKQPHSPRTVRVVATPGGTGSAAGHQGEGSTTAPGGGRHKRGK